jgi:glycosyltransferase involved in cell wall biosynthesis
MKVSIITVTFNSEKYLEETLLSIFSQSYSDIESIVIDGKSTDGTLSILKKYQNKITYICEPDTGIYDAMNKGIELATGDIIGILNSDDVLFDNEIINKVVYSFSSDVDCVYGNVILVNESDKIVRNYSSANFKLKDFEFGHMPPHPSFYVRKEAFQNYGLYNTSFRISSDYDLLLRFLYIHKLKSKYLGFIVVKMRDGGISSSLKNKWLLNKEILVACRLQNINTNFFKYIQNIYLSGELFFLIFLNEFSCNRG